MSSQSDTSLAVKTVDFYIGEKSRVFELMSVDPHVLHHILCTEFNIPVTTFLWYVKRDPLDDENEIIIPESSFPSFHKLEALEKFEVRYSKIS